MTTYVFRNGGWVDKSTAPPLHAPKRGLNATYNFMPDIRPFEPMEGGLEITSRSNLRDYERKHGIRQSGNDWTGSSKPPFWDEMRRGK